MLTRKQRESEVHEWVHHINKPENEDLRKDVGFLKTLPDAACLYADASIIAEAVSYINELWVLDVLSQKGIESAMDRILEVKILKGGM
jgi:hypothetical protein